VGEAQEIVLSGFTLPARGAPGHGGHLMNREKPHTPTLLLFKLWSGFCLKNSRVIERGGCGEERCVDILKF
jgi:hypothetical protein